MWRFTVCLLKSCHKPKCKMASQQQKTGCVPSFYESKSVTTIQRRFQTKSEQKQPPKESVRRPYDSAVTKGRIYQGKSFGRPLISEQTLDRIGATRSFGVQISQPEEPTLSLEFNKAPFGHSSLRGFPLNLTRFSCCWYFQQRTR